MQKCTHLVASKVIRTVKFLTAISVVRHIVTPEWLQESWKCQKFVGEFEWRRLKMVYREALLFGREEKANKMNRYLLNY